MVEYHSLLHRRELPEPCWPQMANVSGHNDLAGPGEVARPHMLARLMFCSPEITKYSTSFLDTSFLDGWHCGTRNRGHACSLWCLEASSQAGPGRPTDGKSIAQKDRRRQHDTVQSQGVPKAMSDSWPTIHLPGRQKTTEKEVEGGLPCIPPREAQQSSYQCDHYMATACKW
jgi:hypothetical protein